MMTMATQPFLEMVLYGGIRKISRDLVQTAALLFKSQHRLTALGESNIQLSPCCISPASMPRVSLKPKILLSSGHRDLSSL